MIAAEAAQTLLDRRAGKTGPAARASAPGGLSIVVRRFAEPSPEFAAAWDDLALHAAEANVFAERWFVRAAARHLPYAANAEMLELWDGAGKAADACLIALLPLRIDPRYGRVPLPHVTNWRHHHSFLGTPLIRAGHEHAAWGALLPAIDRLAWARGLIHFEGLVEDGPVHRALVETATAIGRRCDTVHRIERAMLASALSPQAYYERTIRKKKRKEIKRLQSRLAELGTVEARRLGVDDDVGAWSDMFLALERSGWKGRAGSALASTGETASFFRDALAGAHAAGRLEIVRLDLDRRPIAMLINFLAPPGSFSFKIAFDEDYARFSPGVLVQLENLAILARDEIAWMDSCAVENHPMINSLWAERRPIVRVTLPLAGLRGAALFHLCRAAERASARYRRLVAHAAPPPAQPEPDHDD